MFNTENSTLSEFDVRNKFVTHKTRLLNPEYKILAEEIKRTKDENKKRELKLKQRELKITTNSNIKDFELKTPKEIRANAIYDAFKARSVAFINLKNKNINHFTMKYRRKKEKSKSIAIPKQSLKVNLQEKEISVYSMKIKIKYKKEFEVNNDCRIYKVNNRYYISIPRKIKESQSLKEMSDPQKLRCVQVIRELKRF